MQTQHWEMFSRLAPLRAIRLVDEHFGRESLGRELRTEMLEAEWGLRDVRLGDSERCLPSRSLGEGWNL
jgi:hypothetical protein